MSGRSNDPRWTFRKDLIAAKTSPMHRSASPTIETVAFVGARLKIAVWTS